MGSAISAEDFETLYVGTVRDVLGYVRRRTVGDVENLVAEVYAVAWRRRQDMPTPMLRRAWLFGVARTLLRADGRDRQHQQDLIDQLASCPDPPTKREDNEESGRVVAEALGRLKETDREILRLVAWEGVTPAELAVALGVRPGTARVRLHRARQALASDPAVRTLVERADRTTLTASP